MKPAAVGKVQKAARVSKVGKVGKVCNCAPPWLARALAWLDPRRWKRVRTARYARPAALGLALALALLILGAAVAYLGAVLFLIANRVSPGQARLLSVVSYWRWYGEDPVQVRRLLASLAVAVAIVFLLGQGVLLGGTGWLARRRRSLHGDARFASAAEVRDSGLLKAGPGILLGRWGRQYLSLAGSEFLMLCAPTRSGKGVAIVIPNLLNWPDSVVVVDIKRENFEITAGYRKGHGQEVHLFAPFDEQGRSARFNPLSYVRAEANFRVGDILAIATIFYPLEMRAMGSADGFFCDQARNLFLGLALLLVESPELPRTIGEMLRQASGKRKTIKDHLTEFVHTRLALGRPLSDPCTDALMRFMANSENTLAAILATFNAPLTIFADPLVDAATSGDDFCLTDLRKRRISIYVHVPPHRLAQGALLVNLFFSMLLDQNTRELPAQNPALRHTCLLLLDEFPALGRVVVLEKGVGFVAGYGLRLVTITQSNAMLAAVYGREVARNLSTNHMARVFFAPQELEDAREYSETLGYLSERRESRSVSHAAGRGDSNSVSRSEERRALMLPQELREMDAEHQIVVVQGMKPIWTHKIRFFEDPNFTARLAPPPTLERIDMKLFLASIEGRVEAPQSEPATEGALGRPLEASVAPPTQARPDLASTSNADGAGQAALTPAPMPVPVPADAAGPAPMLSEDATSEDATSEDATSEDATSEEIVRDIQSFFDPLLSPFEGVDFAPVRRRRKTAGTAASNAPPKSRARGRPKAKAAADAQTPSQGAAKAAQLGADPVAAVDGAPDPQQGTGQEHQGDATEDGAQQQELWARSKA